MPSDDKTTETMIQRRGVTAPRIDPPALAGAIIAEYYIHGSPVPLAANAPSIDPTSTQALGLSCLTICVLVLANGRTVVGESDCASPENHHFEISKKIAREKAIDKARPLLGYELRTKLHNEKLASSDGVAAVEVTTADLTPPSGTASSKG